MRLAKEVGFTKAYVAMYSDRPMTAAHKVYTDDVTHEEKKDDGQFLRNLSIKQIYVLERTQWQNKSTMQKLLVISGATATGKTAIGVHLAKMFDGELVSADSRQVYEGMDIGTGKDLKELKVSPYG